MLKQSIRLWSLSAKNLFGINELRYGKDPDKRKRSIIMAIVWSIVAVVFEMYFLISMIGYVMIGLTDILPIYCYTLTSAMVLMFTLLKAGSIIFQMNNYENLCALPVPAGAIVVSRFMTMYTSNILFAAAIMVPGMIVYGVAAGKGFLFILLYLLGIIFAPLLPMTAATALSAVVKGISSRMKHKSLVEAVLMIGFVAAMLAFTSGMGGETVSAESISNISTIAAETISRTYPLAGWFDSSVKTGNILPFVWLAAVSVLIFAVMVYILHFFFGKICMALNVARTKNDYEKVVGSSSTLLMSLVKRELSYYFSQSVYMMNTMMGLVLMVVAAISIVAIGPETIEAQLQINGIVVKTLPFAFSLTAVMMSPTAVSISLEGKTRWLTQSLPIPEKVQYDSKLLMAFILDAPFYVLAVAIAAIGLKITGWNLVWLVVIPAVYLFYAAIWGQTANLLFPNFTWESEVYVVKQGASVLVAMLGGMIGMIIPAFGSIAVQVLGIKGILPNATLWSNLVNLLIVLVILGLSLLLYRKNMRRKI